MSNKKKRSFSKKEDYYLTLNILIAFFVGTVIGVIAKLPILISGIISFLALVTAFLYFRHRFK